MCLTDIIEEGGRVTPKGASYEDLADCQSVGENPKAEQPQIVQAKGADACPGGRCGAAKGSGRQAARARTG